MARQRNENAAGLRASLRSRQDALAGRLDPIGRWSWQVGTETLTWSEESFRIHGVSPDEFDLTLENVIRAYRPEDGARVSTAFAEAVSGRQSFEFEGEIRRPDGARRTIRTVGEFLAGPDGSVTTLFGVMQDITELRSAQSAVERAERRLADFEDMASDWLWEMGPDLRFTYMSPVVEQVTGVPVEFHIGKTRQELHGDKEMSLEMEMHLAWLERHEPFMDFRYWRVGHDGRRQYLSTTGKPIFDADGTFLGYRGSARDLTEEQEAKEALVNANRALKAANKEKSDTLASLQEANALLEERAAELLRVHEEIQHRALHDPLTSIGNRRYLDERIVEWASRCRRENAWLAVLHIDLDRFKQINDTLGHAAGDALLVHVAENLKKTVRREDFVARIGGDEFVVLCVGTEDQKVLSTIAARIIERFSTPFTFEDRECWFGASIGIAAMRGDEIMPQKLLVNADIALYRAKKHGRGRFECFSADVQAGIIRDKAIADGIRSGLIREEFVAYYQPQIDAMTFELAGFEALARWDTPENGVRSPTVFLHIAEELGVVAAIDRQVMERAIKDYAIWRDLGLDVPKISVNVSAKRLMEDDLIAGLIKMDLPHGVLSFELLESAFLDDPEERITWNIDMLREMGIEVELDDFGSGHASLISLIKLAPDAIKIDRELTSVVTGDISRRNLVRSIVDIGKSLGVRVVAEGVETLGQANLLRELGCDVLQGYVFSAPLSPDEVPGFIRDWSAGQRLASVSAAPSAPPRLSSGRDQMIAISTKNA